MCFFILILRRVEVGRRRGVDRCFFLVSRVGWGERYILEVLILLGIRGGKVVGSLGIVIVRVERRSI